MKKSDKILIITEEFDPHSDAVVRALTKRGESVIRLHQSDFPKESTASLEIGGDRPQRIDFDLKGGRSFCAEDVKSIWYRRPSGFRVSEMGPFYTPFAKTQCRQMIDGLWQLLSDRFWVSAVPAMKRAELKLTQLELATRLGLAIPKTLATNDPERVRAFVESTDQPVIYKSFGMPEFVAKVPESPTPEDLDELSTPMLYVTRLTEEHLGNVDSVHEAFGLFQEYVPKDVEIRATVIGRETFAVEIHSQTSEQTKEDWRKYPEDQVPHRVHELPLEVKEKLVAMVEAYGLAFGAFDLVLTPEGQYVFLEINPNGQWQWLEEITGQPMIDTFADLMAAAKLN